MGKKKITEEPEQKPAEYGPLGLMQTHMDKWLFNYLKENLTIEVDCHENWGYYENGNVSVTVSLYLKDPEGKNQLISQTSATA